MHAKHCATAHASPGLRCAHALAWESAWPHANEFEGKEVKSRDEESGLVLSSAVQHPTGDVEMFGGQGLVAF